MSSPLTFSAPPILSPVLKIIDLRIMLASIIFQPLISANTVQGIDQYACIILDRCARFWLASDTSNLLLVHENAFVEDIQALITIQEKLWATDFARKSDLTHLLNRMLEVLLRHLQSTGQG